MPATIVETRVQLASELARARRDTTALFSALKPSYMYERPIAQRHRVIFYVGHLEAFDYIQICVESLGEKPRDPELDRLFQAGIDPDSEHLPSDTPRDWPSQERVESYVADARARVDAVIDEAPKDAVEMALEHRLMHLETLAYMWHNFDYEAKQRPLGLAWQHETGAPPRNDLCLVPGGEARIGKPKNGSFGWDNEYDEHIVYVPQFRVHRFNVTNGEYLQFVRDGAAIPHFWRERNGRLYLRCMFEEIPLPLDWPVYVTEDEAVAYAQWMGKSLMTEAQFHRAAYGASPYDAKPFPWGKEAPLSKHGNFDFRRWDPEPVHATPEGVGEFGIHQLVGNGWEWTSTPFAPFEGFKAAKTYPGYSANFFDGEHFVMKGAAPRTAARLLRRSFRNWFRRDYPYMYAAFRCVEN